MTSLPALLALLTSELDTSPLCTNINIVETRQFSSEQFYAKVRTKLPKDHNLQVRVYYNQGHIDYSYQVFTDTPIIRWDNKEEFDTIETYPHHYHDEAGNVTESPLSGNPSHDLRIVLSAISSYLADE